MRSGCSVSWTAKPSRRNSGFQAISTSTPSGASRARPLGQFGGGAHRHRRLADDHRGTTQPRHQRVDHGVHMAQVGAVFALLLRGSDAEEVHVGEFGRRVVVGGEVQPSRIDVVAQHLSQAGLVERDIARGQLGDLAGVDVDADDFVAQFGHPGGMCRAEIARAEDGASHTAGIGRRDELTAKRHLAADQRQVNRLVPATATYGRR